jgi:hypothetical protein
MMRGHFSTQIGRVHFVLERGLYTTGRKLSNAFLEGNIDLKLKMLLQTLCPSNCTSRTLLSTYTRVLVAGHLLHSTVLVTAVMKTT